MSAHPELPRDSSHLAPRVAYESIMANGQVGWYSERPFLRQLGIGGQGVVYLSIRRGSGSFSLPIAMKLFAPFRFPTAEAYAEEMHRIAGVASRVARIQHDNLVDVQDFLSHQGIHILEMEWLDGYDLQRLLNRDALDHVRRKMPRPHWEQLNRAVVTDGAEQARLKPAVAVGILRECLRGLAALHRADIVHADLKPSNIMLKRSGNVKLIDIGSAYETRRPPSGLPCTPMYAAPEVLQGQLGTPLADLASLGYVVIEMLSGQQPFAGLNLAQLIQAKNTIIDRLPKLLPVEEFAYSEMLIRLIRGLVDPNPENRFPNAEAADLSETGASGFLNQLVKGDYGSDYVVSIRKWVERIETDYGLQSESPDDSFPTTPNYTSDLGGIRPLDSTNDANG